MTTTAHAVNLPNWYFELIEKKLGLENAKIVDTNWNLYGDQHMSFGSSTAAKLMKEARIVLTCVKQVNAA